jgi:hypothetical protein
MASSTGCTCATGRRLGAIGGDQIDVAPTTLRPVGVAAPVLAALADPEIRHVALFSLISAELVSGRDAGATGFVSRRCPAARSRLSASPARRWNWPASSCFGRTELTGRAADWTREPGSCLRRGAHELSRRRAVRGVETVKSHHQCTGASGWNGSVAATYVERAESFRRRAARRSCPVAIPSFA